MKNKVHNSIEKIIDSFAGLDKIISKTFIYYSVILGFIFGWISIAVILLSAGIEMPLIFILFLRVFYFLLSFIIGLKIVLCLLAMFNKYFRKDTY